MKIKGGKEEQNYKQSFFCAFGEALGLLLKRTTKKEEKYKESPREHKPKPGEVQSVYELTMANSRAATYHRPEIRNQQKKRKKRKMKETRRRSALEIREHDRLEPGAARAELLRELEDELLAHAVRLLDHVEVAALNSGESDAACHVRVVHAVLVRLGLRPLVGDLVRLMCGRCPSRGSRTLSGGRRWPDRAAGRAGTRPREGNP